jgi:hypothetical protein
MYPDPGAGRIIVSMQLTLLFAALLAAPTLPSDPRLEPVRAELAQVVDQTTTAGLPSDMLVAKVQEGLAKNVPLPRLVAVVRTLASDLAAAQKFVASVVPSAKPQPALLRALVDAKAAGVAWKDTTVLVRASGDGPVRALQVLTDLAARGYPTTHAAAVVAVVLTRDPQSLSKLTADLDRVRRSHGMTQAEALDDLGSALDKVAGQGQGVGLLNSAIQKVDDSATSAPGNSAAAHDRGPNRDTSGHHGKGK